jgi:hypothetical protein
MRRVDGVLRRFNYDEPHVFRFVDHAYFSFFHGSDGEGSWFVNTRDPKRRAEPISRHEALSITLRPGASRTRSTSLEKQSPP